MYNPKLTEIMSIDLVTLQANDTMDKVDQIFREHTFHHLPVVNDQNEVIGMVSKSDYLMLCDQRTLFLKDKENDRNLLFFKSLLVEEVMATPVAKLRDNAFLSVAVGYFRENLFHAVPVVNAQNKLVGIVTTLDLINYAYNEMNLLELDKSGIVSSNKYP